MEKEDIKDLTLAELKDALVKMGEAPYRAGQIFFWLYKRSAEDFREMKNIHETLKNKLRERFFIGTLECSERLKSREGAEKLVFKLPDNRYIETVIIPSPRRMTLCLSTQVGCKIRCAFCASGMRGFARNLSPSEITNQIIYAGRLTKREFTNFVFMGMGEPLDNCGNVFKAIAIMNDAAGLGIGARRITVSTCGVIPGIRKLAGLGLQVNLSVSLHAANDKLRSELVPLNKRYPLAELIRACKDYAESAGRVITLEYALIKDKNSSIRDAEGTAAIAKELKAKVNLIKCSAVRGLAFAPPAEKDIKAFMERLARKGVKATLRLSKGQDISAACGQLAGRAGAQEA